MQQDYGCSKNNFPPTSLKMGDFQQHFMGMLLEEKVSRLWLIKILILPLPLNFPNKRRISMQPRFLCFLDKIIRQKEFF